MYLHTLYLKQVPWGTQTSVPQVKYNGNHEL